MSLFGVVAALLILCLNRSHCLQKPFDVSRIKCLVCEKLIEEIENEVSKIAPNKKSEVGSYSIDGKGNSKKSPVQMRKSEVFLLEVLESVCEKMDDYVRVTHKETGESAVLKLLSADGKMASILHEYDIVTDGDIKTLKYNCESIVQEHDELIIDLFRSGASKIDIRVCSQAAKYCNVPMDDDDYNFEDERDEL